MKENFSTNSSDLEIKKQKVSEIVKDSIYKSTGDSLEGCIEELVIHGDTFRNKEGQEVISLKPDLDGRGAIFLLELAGVKYKKLTFVPKGESVAGSFNIDTGERDGFDIEGDGSIFFDHHGEKWANPTSATKMIYDFLVEKGHLERKEWIDNLANFITDIDNLSYPITDTERKAVGKSHDNYFRKEWFRSLYGLERKLSFEELVKAIEYFTKQRRNIDSPLSSAEIEGMEVMTKTGEKVTLLSLCDKTQEEVKDSDQGVAFARKHMEQIGVREETDELGRILLNVTQRKIESKEEKNRLRKTRYGNLVSLGFPIVKANGFDSYVIWNERDGSFFITSSRNLESVFSRISQAIPEAKLLRGTMIVRPRINSETEDGVRPEYKPDELLKILGMKE